MPNSTFDTNTLSRLGGYLLAAGGASLATNAAVAAVTPINVSVNITATAGNPVFAEVDVNGDATNDFRFDVYDGDDITIGQLNGSGMFAQVFNGACAALPFPPSAYYAGNVAAGAAIPGALDFIGWGVLWEGSNPTNAVCNNFVSGQWGLLAISFVAGGNTHYGYLNVRRSAGSQTLEINGGAYESTAGAAMLAGRPYATIPVPVGAAVPLGISLLIVGAAGLRRRRQARAH